MARLRTIAVLAFKGGAGKTTLSLNLAAAARLDGRSVVLADADPQRSAALAARTRRLAGVEPVETCAAKLYALGHAAGRAGAEVLVIDTPAGRETDMVAAANIADLCLLVTRPCFLDIAAAVRTAEVVRRVGGRGLTVLNQAPCARDGHEHPGVLKALEALRFVGLPIAPVTLRSRMAVQAALAHGLGVGEWAPASPAAAEFSALWREVEANLQPAAAPAPRPSLGAR